MKLLFFLPTFCSGGAEAFVVNVVEELTQRGHVCSIVSIDGVRSIYDNRLSSIGVTRDELIPSKEDSPAVRYLRAYSLFASYLARYEGAIDAIHFNAAQGEELPFIWIAKRAHIPVRILHSHNSLTTSPIKRVGHYLCKLLFPSVATHYLACSDKAAEWLLPKSVLDSGRYAIAKNGIKTERFRFCEEERSAKRREMGLEQSKCYMCVGRLDYQKNHVFLLKVLNKLLAQDSKATLVLVGEGPLADSLHEQAQALGIEKSIVWLGVRDDVDALLCAADCFLLSSEFEGFPFTLVEAQASGLPCIVSDRVSSSCAITDLVTFSPLDEDEFARKAGKVGVRGATMRDKYADTVKRAGYDIVSTVDTLEKLYFDASCA